MAARVLGVGVPTFDRVFVVDGGGAAGKWTATRAFVQPGGQVPTALVALRRWGLETSFLGPLGDDDGGRLQAESLRAEGVAVLGAVCPGVASHESFIAVDQASGERTIYGYRDPSLALGAVAFSASMLDAVDAVLLDGEERDLAVAVAGAARAAGVAVMVDLDEASGAEEILELTDYAVVSGDFVSRFSGSGEVESGLRAIGRLGPGVVVATLGDAGALMWSGGRLRRESGVAVDVVDTTSAGDVFHAGFLFAVLSGRAPAEALRVATGAAALCCTRLGGRASIPTLAELAAARLAGADEVG